MEIIRCSFCFKTPIDGPLKDMNNYFITDNIVVCSKCLDAIVTDAYEEEWSPLISSNTDTLPN